MGCRLFALWGYFEQFQEKCPEFRKEIEAGCAQFGAMEPTSTASTRFRLIPMTGTNWS